MKGYVPADGTGANRVLLVGEAAGENEAAQGKPFVGAAGSYLNRVLRRAGLRREDFRVHNVLSCRPPDNRLSGMPWEFGAISWCRPNLDATISEMRPGAIVALGNIPLRRLTGGDSITRYRGFVMTGPGGIPVVPTFHPSYLLPRRGQAKTSRFVGAVALDLKRAVEIAQHGFRRRDPHYLCDPPPAEALAFAVEYESALAGDPWTFLSADIETPFKLKTPDEQALTGGDEEDEDDTDEGDQPPTTDPILRISFSFRPHYGMSVPWLPPYIPIIQRLLGGAGPKVFWNCPTPDQKVLTADLRWIEAGTLKVGDELVGFDEFPEAGRKTRRFRKTAVTHVERMKAVVYTVRFRGGKEVKVTGEHQWLAHTSSGKPYQWIATNKLRPGNYVTRFFSPWETKIDRNSGYLAGFFDGEGHLTTHAKSHALVVGASQHRGATLDRVISLLAARYYKPAGYGVSRAKDAHIAHVRLNGRVTNKARFLGEIRPHRLLSKFRPEMLGALQSDRAERLEVVAVECLGEQEIVGLSTSTKTYILEGFGAHNCGFDIPVLRRNSVTINGPIYDAMWAWHFLQSDLPRGLEFVSSFYTDLLPWKHTSGEDPARYNAIDSDAALRNMLGIRAALERTGQWGIFVDHVVELDPILYAMGQVNGVHIDRVEQEKLKTFLQGEKVRLLAEAQEAVPEVLKPFKDFAKEREGTVEVPADLFVRVCSACAKENVNKKHPCIAKEGATIVQQVRKGSKWRQRLPFNPNSRTQLMAYVVHHGHPVGKDHKSKKDSLNKKHVEGLKKKYGGKHPIYGIALSLRAVSKTLGTYVVGFAPDAKGRIYTVLGHAPSTGRLSSSNVNLQNVSHRGTAKYAKEVRRTIIPSPGRVFVECDSSAIEAVMVGYFMGDSDYIAIARKGVHAKLTCFELGLPFTTENIARVKEEFKDVYDRNKITVHGTNYGMGPGLMALQWPDEFPSVSVARATQERYFKMVPKLAEWHHQVRVTAHKQTYLVNPWGYRHYFYNVFGAEKDGVPTLADDAKRCVAFLPQSSAAAFMKDTLKILWEKHQWVRPFMPAIGSIHDSCALDVPTERAEEAIELLAEVMTRPIERMGGLRVGAEVKIGPNWGDMKVVRVKAVA